MTDRHTSSGAAAAAPPTTLADGQPVVGWGEANAAGAISRVKSAGGPADVSIVITNLYTSRTVSRPMTTATTDV